ncbi:hypothetical protein GCM10011376_01760 [Nocardioides flavus (ex Wang et al. 2016)]|uniref:DUF3592 domain-containing protein n=1 Tax=Nocardioides flavus (ex Wang et al. 2016) TaxID=2058780 RepID=A0ABQ3HDB0_9ACTN|nr:hypothetical protein [Nocardioides flavus (ex Wang et al. 2016)]GHE15110.1 hypothetical protein GCM10011376_01760 [Nocardioides flavus (ex Wang et al. 2016)]
MSPNRRSDRLVIWVCSLAVLAGAGVLLGFTVRDVVRHVSADDQPATITAIGGTGSRVSTNDRRRSRSISFRLEDGSEHADAAEGRWFWWPDEGDTIHVHQVAPGDWEISEEFSWLRTLGFAALFLLPWVVALLKVWEWGQKRRHPERWAAKERESRDRVRQRLDRKRQSRGT